MENHYLCNRHYSPFVLIDKIVYFIRKNVYYNILDLRSNLLSVNHVFLSENIRVTLYDTLCWVLNVFFLSFFVFNPTFYHYRVRDTLIFTYYLVYNRKKIVIIFGFVKNALVDTSTSS